MQASALIRTTMIVLTPFAIYALWIASLNRKASPTYVTGFVDGVNLILAFSGIWFYLAPALLTGFNFWPSDVWLYNHFSSFKHPPKGSLHNWWPVWWLATWAAYVALITAGVIVLLWRQRTMLSFYNVDFEKFEYHLQQILNSGNIRWQKLGERFLVLPTHSTTAAFDLERWPRLHLVTLRWLKFDRPLRAAVEKAIQENPGAFGRRGPQSNPPMIAAAMLFGVLFVLAVGFQYARFKEAGG